MNFALSFVLCLGAVSAFRLSAVPAIPAKVLLRLYKLPAQVTGGAVLGYSNEASTSYSTSLKRKKRVELPIPTIPAKVLRLYKLPAQETGGAVLGYSNEASTSYSTSLTRKKRGELPIPSIPAKALLHKLPAQETDGLVPGYSNEAQIASKYSTSVERKKGELPIPGTYSRTYFRVSS